MTGIKIPFVLDPKDGNQSVSLTLVVLFGLAALICNILKGTGKIDDIAGLNELFYSTLALYFSRRNLNIGGKNFSSTQAQDLEKKVEDSKE